MASALRLRKVTPGDMRAIYDLSNDPSVRANSIRKDAIPWEDHVKWFKGKVDSPDNVFYAVEDETGAVVGQIRFGIRNGLWISNMCLAPHCRGKGQSEELLVRSLEMSGLHEVYGFVRKDNARSQAMLVGSGHDFFHGLTVEGAECILIAWRRGAFVIAEMSANHRGDLARAKELILAAKEAGADAVKLQTYTADTMTIDSGDEAFVLPKGTLWQGRRLYDVYRDAATPWEWTAELKEFAERAGILLFSTPFDRAAVDFLAGLDVGMYKIASCEAVDIPLIRHAAARKRPILISTGISTLEEMQDAVDACHAEGNTDVTLLKCTTAYPARPETMNLLTIRDMVDRFGPQHVRIGLSDHTRNPEVAVAAIALGARVVEKHLTLDRPEGDAEAAFSLTPDEFAEMVRSIRVTEASLGHVSYAVSPDSRRYARSLYVCDDIRSGSVFTEDNVRSIRPNGGCAPKLLPEILGRRAACDLRKGTPMRMDYVATT